MIRALWYQLSFYRMEFSFYLIEWQEFVSCLENIYNENDVNDEP